MSVWAMAILMAGLAPAAAAAEVGAPVEVAPKAEGSRAQSWASAAWSEGAKCWLVVWREGCLNEPETGSDIWCARVSADGKALDPAGIRLTKGKGLKDHPRVASGGNDFLVVWEDLGNGRDPSTAGSGQGWDVCGGRVSGEGKLLDAQPLTLAGGERNQARPDVTFHGDSYLLVYQNYSGDGFPGFGAGYLTRSLRVTGDGRPGAAVEVKVALGSPGAAKGVHAIDPVAVSRGAEAMVFAVQHTGGQFSDTYLGWRSVDARGAFNEQPKPDYSNRNKPPTTVFGDTRTDDSVRYAAAMGTDGALAAAGGSYYRGGDFRLYRIGANGDWNGEHTDLQWVGFDWQRRAMRPCVALTFDGGQYLLAAEWIDHGKPDRIEIHGYFIGADGKILSDVNNGFTIAAEAGKNQVMPAAAAGPRGVSLVVYSEFRGVDDMKLVARLVK
jgi:hypothetical protein